MPDHPFRIRQAGAIVTIEIDRPEKRNSLRLTEINELGNIFSSRPVLDARCLILRGAGDSFCAGRDVNDIEPEREDAYDILRNQIGAVLRQLHALPVPTLAAVRGPALGFGLGLALACDMTVASEDALFGSPFRRIGAVLDSGGHYYFQRRLGSHRAAELVFTGRMLSGKEAAALGLINEAVVAENFDARIGELAALIASGPTATFRATKHILAEDRSLADVLELEATYQKEVMRGPDGKEGLAAFRERRAPKFSGN